MKFIYKLWESFCKDLNDKDIHSIAAKDVNCDTEKYLVLKHDVETNVLSAYKIAKIEKKFKHCGTYYVQAYLLNDEKNVSLLKEMQQMGHEISYHYDVMDSNKGDIEKALVEFENNRLNFESEGFLVETVCQHGNPVIERVGYTSNRDFFRSKKVQQQYPDISDIMVNFKVNKSTNYLYFSDAGHCFNMIYDPINNDIIDTSSKNIKIKDINELIKYIYNESCIVSIHPHRWTSCAAIYVLKEIIFKTVKFVAKLMLRIPILEKIMSRYYYLAKKL